MSTRRDHSRERCLFSAMSSQEKTAIRISAFLIVVISAVVMDSSGGCCSGPS